MAYDDDETLAGGETDDTTVDDDSSDDDDASGSSSSDSTVFELIVEADEPTSVPDIGEEGCFENILTKLEDSKNSQTLRYEIAKQEEAAKTTKNYSFGRF